MLLKIILILIAIITISLIGRFRLAKELRSTIKVRDFLVDYTNRYVNMANQYLNHGTVDSQLYSWLTLNSNRAQSEIGTNGIIAYSAPFNRISSTRYEVIVNTLPKFRTGLYHKEEVYIVEDSLTRAIGSYDNFIEIQDRKSKTPVSWFQSGIKYILETPIQTLFWFGVITEGVAGKIKRSKLFAFLTAIAGLAAFLSSIITIFGWENCRDLVVMFINKLK